MEAQCISMKIKLPANSNLTDTSLQEQLAADVAKSLSIPLSRVSVLTVSNTMARFLILPSISPTDISAAQLAETLRLQLYDQSKRAPIFSGIVTVNAIRFVSNQIVPQVLVWKSRLDYAWKSPAPDDVEPFTDSDEVFFFLLRFISGCSRLMLTEI